MSRNHLIVWLFSLLTVFSASCTTARRPPPNILIIVVDTLRADRLGCYGNERGLTPFIDELCERGYVFKNAYAGSSWTVPSVATLLTSRYPSQHGVATFDSKVGEQELTLAEKTAALEYRSLGLSANFRLTRELGYAQGFDTWKVFPPSGTKGKPVKIRGMAHRSATLDWLDNQTDDSRRLIYLQYMEPHAPYQPTEPFHSRFRSPKWTAEAADAANKKTRTINFRAFSADEIEILETLYDGEVAALDAELRILFGDLEKRGFFDNALVIITSDHGEEFREHGRMSHGHDLYNETLRVPLIFLLPDSEAGGVIEQNVSLIDIAPTVLAILEQPPEPRFEGRSLLPLMQDGAWANRQPGSRDIIGELPPTGSKLDLRRHERAIIRDSTKLMTPARRRDTREIFDLAGDPLEERANPPALATHADSLEKALSERLAELQSRAAEKETAEIDEATKEKLRALGYQF